MFPFQKSAWTKTAPGALARTVTPSATFALRQPVLSTLESPSNVQVVTRNSVHFALPIGIRVRKGESNLDITLKNFMT